MAGVEVLRQRVLAAFASLHNQDVSRFQTVLARPPLYAAYRDYVEGLEVYMAGDEAEAARRFQQAATLDPTFLTARIWTAQSGMLAGMYEMDEAWARLADSLISGLRLLRDRLAPFLSGTGRRCVWWTPHLARSTHDASWRYPRWRPCVLAKR